VSAVDPRSDDRRHGQIARLTLLHADKDLDLIAEVTGQPTEWLRTADGAGG
jgi:hypothetical protein